MSKTVQFTDTSTNANTYYWQFGDGNTSGDRNPIHTYGEYGDYVVVLTITDNNGNSDEFQQNVSLSLPNVDEPPVDETTEEETTEETTDEETSYEDDTEETTTEDNEDGGQETENDSEQETTSTEPRPGYPPTGYNPLTGNLRIGVVSPEGQWTWNGQAWILNSSTTTVTGTDNDDTSTTESEDTSGDDSDTGGGRPTFDYTLTGMLSGRQAGVDTTFNIDVDSVNYSSLLPELSNYIGQTMIANGAPRTITNFQTSGTGYGITLQGNVGNPTPGARYNFSINITSIQDLSGNDGNDDGGGYGGRSGVTGP